MKYIKKRSRPRSLYQWHRVNAKIADAQFNTHQFPNKEVHEALMEEQGYICAYTMIRIDTDSSHIEHLKPRTVSRQEGMLAETSDYQNMVTCYPRERKAGRPITFGAVFRDDEWDARRFVTPLMASCESRIRFGTDGRVRRHRSDDEGAEWTINTLALHDAKLTELRVAAIEARGVSLAADDAVSRDEAERIIATICRRDGGDRFHPYCVAIRHAAEEYIALLDKASNRRKYAMASRKRGRK